MPDSGKGKRPKNSGPQPTSEARLRGSLLRLRSMMRLELNACCGEWHLRGKEGHDGLITAGYRSSYSHSAVDLRRSASARTLKEKKDNEGETSNGDTCEQSRDEVQGVMHR